MSTKNIYSGFLVLIFFFLGLTAISGMPVNRGDNPDQISIVVSGKILNDSSQQPVINHAVIVRIPYINYNSTVYTDQDGNYSDTISQLPGLGDTVFVSTYDCHNILHSQKQPIQSYSIIINFFICENFSPHCNADFICELDSSSTTPRRYRFIDLSTGNPDNWHWDFGDGNSSNDRNPVHIYSKPGHYKICLTISREHMYGPCSDSSCTNINTPSYHSIGGHVFAGSLPINNPGSTGDTGIAYLYRYLNNRISAFDTLYFTYLGYYSFPHLLPGDYLIKIALSQGSVHARDYIPTYYRSELYWGKAEILQVSESSIFDLDVFLTRSGDSLSGTGSISGRVEMQYQTSSNSSLYRSEVLLLDTEKNSLSYALSDVAGNFSLNGLPFGNYLLYVESTGKFSKYTPVTITAQTPSVDTLVLKIYDHNVTGIGHHNSGNILSCGKPFPNPSGGVFHTRVSSGISQQLWVRVFTSQSMQILEQPALLNPGSSEIITDLSSFPGGIYFMLITDEHGEKVLTAKLVKI